MVAPHASWKLALRIAVHLAIRLALRLSGCLMDVYGMQHIKGVAEGWEDFIEVFHHRLRAAREVVNEGFLFHTGDTTAYECVGEFCAILGSDEFHYPRYLPVAKLSRYFGCKITRP